MGTYQLFPAPVLTQRPVSLFVMKPLPPPIRPHPYLPTQSTYYGLRGSYLPLLPKVRHDVINVGLILRSAVLRPRRSVVCRIVAFIAPAGRPRRGRRDYESAGD